MTYIAYTQQRYVLASTCVHVSQQAYSIRNVTYHYK